MDTQQQNTFLDEGVEANLGFGHKFVFYPISWGAMRRLRKEWDLVFGGTNPGSPEWQEALGKLLHASVSRADASITLDQFMDALDTRNIKRCFEALTAANGLRKKEGDESRPTSP